MCGVLRRPEKRDLGSDDGIQDNWNVRVVILPWFVTCQKKCETHTYTYIVEPVEERETIFSCLDIFILLLKAA